MQGDQPKRPRKGELLKVETEKEKSKTGTTQNTKTNIPVSFASFEVYLKITQILEIGDNWTRNTYFNK